MFPDKVVTEPLIFKFLVLMITVVCTWGAFALFRQSSRNRARLFVATSLLIWAVPYLLRVIRNLFGLPFEGYGPPLYPPMCFAVLYFNLVLLPYPVELIRPGWLTWRRGFFLAIPALITLTVYCIYVAIHGAPEDYGSFEHLYAKRYSFGVWYRFVILGVTGLYLLATFLLALAQEDRYKRWCELNYADGAESHGIAWLYAYVAGMFIMTGIFIWSLHSPGALPALLHAVAVLIFFCFVICRALRYDSPFPEGFFEQSSKADIEDAMDDDAIVDTLSPRIPEYTALIAQWFDDEQPYLDRNFKLTDTARILPLNRSYLSKIYTEGFGKSFSELVRDRRMEEARRLLIEAPELSISEIAEKCGFSSHSSFHRSFAAMHGGETPGEYRTKNT